MISRRTTASPQRVWAVLADGWRYADWVVGADRIRAVQGAWPHTGARIHHTVGVWPGQIDDETEVLACDPGRRLVLLASGRPAGRARVEIALRPLPDGGCRVTICEDVTSGAALLVPGPVRRYAMDVRNAECLRRLSRIAEGRALSGS